MKCIRKCTALAIVIAMILTLFAGCGNPFESATYHRYLKFENSVADGDCYDKTDVVEKLGKPEYYQGKTDGTDYMDASVGWWRYEMFDRSGYPWALSITFDRDGQVTSAEFAPGVGG